MNKSHNHDHIFSNRLAIKYGKYEMILNYKEGGACTIPETVTATAGGGTAAAGLYDATTVEGVVIADLATMQTLMKVYQRGGLLSSSSAVHTTLVPSQQMMRQVFFGNARVSKIPEPTGANHGDESYWTISLSLNDITDVKFESLIT